MMFHGLLTHLIDDSKLSLHLMVVGVPGDLCEVEGTKVTASRREPPLSSYLPLSFCEQLGRYRTVSLALHRKGKPSLDITQAFQVCIFSSRKEFQEEMSNEVKSDFI